MTTQEIIREYNIRKREILETYNKNENAPGASQKYNESIIALDVWADKMMREADNGI